MLVLQIARKELRRRRASSVGLAAAVALLVLLAALFVPRSWTSQATVALDADPTSTESPDARVRALVSKAAGAQPVLVTRNGERFNLRLSTASPEQATESLELVIDTVLQAELGRLRASLEADAKKAEAQVSLLTGTMDALDAEMTAGRSQMPAGGESALGARIGQLQGERDALKLDLRGKAELQARLSRRIADLDREIAELKTVTPEQDPLAPQRIDIDLKPQRVAANSRLAALREEIALDQRRLTEVESLIDSASRQTDDVRQGREDLQELQRQYDDVVAQRRQARVRLEAARDALALRVTPAELDFRVISPPSPPEAADGLPAWLWVLSAFVAGGLAGFLRLIGIVLIGAKVRSAEQVIVGAELPVLAVITDFPPTQPPSGVRWPLIGLGLLLVVLAVAATVFLRMFG